MKHIYKCGPCRAYTMKETCPKCGSRTIIAKPLKYSPDDKLAPYRRTYRMDELRERGLI